MRQRFESGNLLQDTIKRLSREYPSRSFIIDKLEARELFAKVEDPNAILTELSDNLREILVEHVGQENSAPIITFMSEEKKDEKNEAANNADEPDNKRASGNGQGRPENTSDSADGDSERPREAEGVGASDGTAHRQAQSAS